MPMKVRDPFFDIVKLVAIFMVVFRHAMLSAETSLYPIWVSNATVGMNMPIFFLLSGWFAWPTIEVCDWAKLGRHLKSYMWPTVTTIVLLASIHPFCCVTVWNIRDVLVCSIKTWLFGPWFIWVLCSCYIIVFLSRVVGRSMWGTMAIALLVLVALMFVPECRGIVYKTSLRHMLPYFAFGAALRCLNVKPWMNNYVGAASLVGFMLVVCLEGDASRNGMSFYYSDSSWHAVTHWRSAFGLIARPLLGVAGSFGAMWVVKCSLSAIRNQKSHSEIVNFLAKGGTLTLAIYLLHQRILAWLVAFCPEFTTTRVRVFLVAMLVFIVCWFISDITVNRIPFTRKWFWGK